jgi:hypothetical protein
MIIITAGTSLGGDHRLIMAPIIGSPDARIAFANPAGRKVARSQ